jgi:hypothetical protein
MSAPLPVADRGEAFDLLDKVAQAKGQLQGTIAVALRAIGNDDIVGATLWRHIEADNAALDEAFAAAWDRLAGKGDET